MIYQIVVVPMTLSDLQGHAMTCTIAPIAGLLNAFFCAVVQHFARFQLT